MRRRLRILHFTYFFLDSFLDQLGLKYNFYSFFLKKNHDSLKNCNIYSVVKKMQDKLLIFFLPVASTCLLVRKKNIFVIFKSLSGTKKT